MEIYEVIGVIKMYQEEYKRWLDADLEDADLNPELTKIAGNEEEIKERFACLLYTSIYSCKVEFKNTFNRGRRC